MDHYNYCANNFPEETVILLDTQDTVVGNDGSEVSDNIKFGDELLIDLVRSRPYLYDKIANNYKNAQLKDNAWKEMAEILNISSKF